MMRIIISHSNDYNFKTKDCFNQEDFVAPIAPKVRQKKVESPVQSPSNKKISYLKMKVESPVFLERIQKDICGPINPMFRPF
jgi:hypothetical protein